MASLATRKGKPDQLGTRDLWPCRAGLLAAALPDTTKRCVNSFAAQGARRVGVIPSSLESRARPEAASDDSPQTRFSSTVNAFPRSSPLMGSSMNPEDAKASTCPLTEGHTHRCAVAHCLE